MKKGSGKSKGSGYERLISKKLSLWLSENQRDDLIWRTQNSGGRFTTRFKKGKNTKGQDGDITNTDPLVQWFFDAFSLELKHYRDLNLWSLFVPLRSDCLISFWKQAVKQGLNSNKIPILIAKQNNRPDLFVTNKKLKTSILEYYKLKPIVRTDDMFIYTLEEILSLDSKTFKLMTNNEFNK